MDPAACDTVVEGVIPVDCGVRGCPGQNVPTTFPAIDIPKIDIPTTFPNPIPFCGPVRCDCSSGVHMQAATSAPGSAESLKLSPACRKHSECANLTGFDWV